jgi:hypothetical protein
MYHTYLKSPILAPIEANSESIRETASLTMTSSSHSNAAAYMNDHDFFSEQHLLIDSLGFSFDRPHLPLDMNLIYRISCEGKIRETSCEDHDFFHLPRNDDATSSLTPQEAYALTYRPLHYYDALVASLSSTRVTDLITLIQQKRDGAKIILCPQHLPKFHPSFDYILLNIMKVCKTALLVLVHNDSKGQWRRNLEKRWRKVIGLNYLRRFVWLPNLNPQEYLSVLAIGDLMIGEMFAFLCSVVCYC